MIFHLGEMSSGILWLATTEKKWALKIPSLLNYNKQNEQKIYCILYVMYMYCTILYAWDIQKVK